MNHNENGAQSHTPTALLRDLSFPVDHAEEFLDLRTNTANEEGTHQHLFV